MKWTLQISALGRNLVQDKAAMEGITAGNHGNCFKVGDPAVHAFVYKQ